MKVQAIKAWFNYSVKIQRRAANPSTNELNEPSYGDPSTWPVVNDPSGNTTHKVRIEYVKEEMNFTPTGERITQKQTLMFVSADDDIRPEDRVTIQPSTVNPNLNNYFIVLNIWPENDAVGNVSHYVAELQVP